MSRDPLDILQTVFGYPAFRPLQGEIIAAVTAGEDRLAIMPTGAGKSLCYQIPAIARPGTGLVISPLVALMHDQVRALKAAGVSCAAVTGDTSVDERMAAFRALDDGTLDLLYVAPERATMPEFQDRISRAQLALIAIDEAHCVSEWGHDFRPDYRQLRPLADRFPGVPRIGLTATADKVTQEDIAHQLGISEAQVVVAGFDRPNIIYTVQEGAARTNQMLNWLEDRRGRSGIVYAPTRAKVDAFSAQLVKQGFNARAYHAGLTHPERRDAQEMFVTADDLIMVATVAFGMGIDKPDVRFVAHMALPKSIEAYYQETGRAGRDGAPAETLMLWGAADVARARSQIDEGYAEGAESDKQRVDHQKLSALTAFAASAACRRIALLTYFGEPAPAPCGNCDNCLNPPELTDVSEDAVKLLSAVYRTGQRFGLGHVAAVLAGDANDRAVNLGHTDLGVFGLTPDKDMKDWRPVQQQLVAMDALRADARHGGISLGPAARDILRGETKVTVGPQPETRKRRRRRGGADLPSLSAADGALFEALRGLRKEIAAAQNVPAYVVFNDATLQEMAAAQPADLDAMGRISGVGAMKLERFGAQFLDAIRQHVRG
ncbi:DNA helicase RecQ [Pacificimonas sp. WHA3]|uniref:DNA helicase RecQ n=1 Tax=Pacificimonas pallii TaxID=2827236 RepID=A0ABS6SA78_9SPHN|nr:DNA helicase RecQ [Pacificimonas pallii]MBV7255267.1 DNA helicase RecQ [Pacificimonas pallii]